MKSGSKRKGLGKEMEAAGMDGKKVEKCGKFSGTLERVHLSLQVPEGVMWPATKC